MGYLTIPNALTALRIVLVLPITLAFLRGSIAWALALYVIAAFTDFFDGMIARRTGTASEFGAKLDAFADGLFGIGIFAWAGMLYPQDRTALLVLLGIALATLVVQGLVSLALFGKIVSLHLQPGRVAAVIVATLFLVVVLWGHAAILLGIWTGIFIATRAHTVWHFTQMRSTDRSRKIFTRK